MTSKREGAPRRVGRPPAGDGGERVKDYPQVSLRLPAAVRDKLAALSLVRRIPQWRLVAHSLEAYLRRLPRRDQLKVARVLAGRRSSDAV